jgi:hypothetical protein
VFSAYIYYVVEVDQYQAATSYVKTAALLSALLSGVLGDLLVVFAHTSLTTLMWLSAGFVWAGFALGLGILRPSNKSNKVPAPITPRHLHHFAGAVGDEESGERGAASLTSRFVSFFYPSRRNPSSLTSGARDSDVMRSDDDDDDHPETATSGLLFSDNPFMHRESMRGVSGDVSHNTKTKFSSSRSLRLYQQRKRHKRLLRQKLRLFAYQLRQLCEAMRYPAVLTMVVLWIIGNAVYSVSHQTLYLISLFDVIAYRSYTITRCLSSSSSTARTRGTAQCSLSCSWAALWAPCCPPGSMPLTSLPSPPLRPPPRHLTHEGWAGFIAGLALTGRTLTSS